MPETAIDLKWFCQDEVRSSLAIHQPWVYRGWWYATNGRIAVRVPAHGEPDTPPVLGGDGKVRTFPSEILVEEFGRLPPCESPLPELKGVDCPRCKGTGEHLCKLCKTKHLCGRCGGRGKLPNDQRIGERCLAGGYLKLIAELPEVSVCLEGGPDTPFAFVSGELQGILLPLYP